MKTLKLLSMLFVASALCFTSCSKNDDDEYTSDVTNYSSIIPGLWINTVGNTEDNIVSLHINHNGVGTIFFYDMINTDDGQYGVMASGNYSLNGSKLTATYDDVQFQGKVSNWKSDTYHGFSNGKTKTVVYTIQSYDGNKLVMNDNSGNTFVFEKY